MNGVHTGGSTRQRMRKSLTVVIHLDLELPLDAGVATALKAVRSGGRAAFAKQLMVMGLSVVRGEAKASTVERDQAEPVVSRVEPARDEGPKRARPRAVPVTAPVPASVPVSKVRPASVVAESGSSGKPRGLPDVFNEG